MRFLLSIATVLAPVATAQVIAAPARPTPRASLIPGSECPGATRYFAERGGNWQGKPVKPQKLTELPPAEAFAAVLRHDERGCIVPVKYPDVRR